MPLHKHHLNRWSEHACGRYGGWRATGSMSFRIIAISKKARKLGGVSNVINGAWAHIHDLQPGYAWLLPLGVDKAC